MKSRYDYMKESKVLDIDGEPYPDPLTIDYQNAVKTFLGFPNGVSYNFSDMKKLWVKFYKTFQETEGDDIFYSVNGVEHVGVLEPGDVLYKFNMDGVKMYDFVNLD